MHFISNFVFNEKLGKKKFCKMWQYIILKAYFKENFYKEELKNFVLFNDNSQTTLKSNFLKF